MKIEVGSLLVCNVDGIGISRNCACFVIPVKVETQLYQILYGSINSGRQKVEEGDEKADASPFEHHFDLIEIFRIEVLNPLRSL